MEAIETGSYERFVQNLDETGNTVCGRHPIGVVMATIEVLRNEGKIGEKEGKFHFVRYERSGQVTDADGSSVSYACAFAIL